MDPTKDIEQQARKRSIDALAHLARAFGHRAKADRGSAGPAPDEQSAGVGGIGVHQLMVALGASASALRGPCGGPGSARRMGAGARAV